MIDLGRQRLLVLAPHPDDEVIGCGGLISRVKAQGGEVYVQFVTVGDTDDASLDGFSSAEERHAEIARVADLLGIDRWEVLLNGADHLALDTVPQKQLIGAIESSGTCSIGAVRPSIVALPDPTSYNQDHRAVAAAALSALRPGDPQLRHVPDGVLVYEQVADQWSLGLHFTPNTAVDLDEPQLETKLEAMRTYKSQSRLPPSTRSAEALEAMAYYRGAHFGCERAEAFQSLRWRV